MALRLFKPILAGARPLDRLLAGVGAAVSIALTMVICAGVPIAPRDLPLIVAPMGASAVLIFAVPASPLAQPWPVIGGNLISALVGVAAFKAIPDVPVAAGVAVGGAILLMSLARCLHPPGGAAALTAVIGSEAIHTAGFGFALAPVGLNALVLALLGVAFHRLSGHSYPHRPQPAAVPQGLHLADIDAALEALHESFDISREDLDVLLSTAEAHAAARRSGGVAK